MPTIRSSPSGPEFDLTTDEIQNLSDLPGLTLTDALDSVAPATGTENGYLTQTVIPSGTTVVWTNVNQIPAGDFFRVIEVGGGSSGSGGMRQPGGNASSGGACGGGGCFRELFFSRADLVTLVTAVGGLTIIAAAAVAGGAGRASGNNGAQLPGAAGNFSQFGPFKAFGGGGPLLVAPGVDALTNSGGGGGALSAGQTGTGSICAFGGAPSIHFTTISGDILDGTGVGGGAGGFPDNASTAAGLTARSGCNSEDGGSGGGCAAGSAATNGSGSGGTACRGGGGGGGGAAITAGGVARAAGNGGSSGGTSGGTAAAGAPGGNGLPGNTTHAGTGGAGGGVGFNGGDGGFPGGAGGGGGANGGAGGAGAGGTVIIEAY